MRLNLQCSHARIFWNFRVFIFSLIENDWQRETQNDWTKTRDRGFDLRNSTSSYSLNGNFQQLVFDIFAQSFSLGIPRRGRCLTKFYTERLPPEVSTLTPYRLFPLTIDYPTHPCHILQLVNSLSFDTDPKPEKGTPFVGSLPV